MEPDKALRLLPSRESFDVMARKHSREEDEEAAKRGAEKLRKLLADPDAFYQWANEMLDSSRRRRKR